jgi:hypothetical protein
MLALAQGQDTHGVRRIGEDFVDEVGGDGEAV